MHGARRSHAAVLRLGVASMLCAALLATGTQCRAQHILLGPTVGTKMGTIVAEIPVFAGSPGCGSFSAGRLRGQQAGACMLMPELFGGNIGISFGLGWSRWHGSFSALPAEPFWATDPRLDSAVQGDRQFRLEAAVDRIEIEALGSATFGRFGVGVGATLAAAAHATIVQTDTILGPVTAAFDDGRSGHTMRDGTLLQARTVSFGGMLAAWYTAKFARRFDLQIRLAGTADITSPLSGATLRAVGLHGSIALLFDVSPDGNSIATQPTIAIAEAPPPENSGTSIAELLPPRRATLSASIVMYGLNEHGESSDAASVRVHETVVRREVALDPAVRFPTESGTLPTRYTQHAPADPGRFSVDTLQSLEDPALQSEILNVLGFRLRTNPTASIVLGCPAGGLWRRRVGSIRAYLAEAWGIDTARITADYRAADERTESDGRNDAFVRIAAADTSTLAPLMFHHTDRDFKIPIVKLDPSFQSTAGIRRWTITLSHHGSVLARYTSNGDGARNDSLYEWKPEYDRLTRDTSHLEATFTIEDSTGAVETARARIPLRVESDRRWIVRRSDMRSGSRHLLYQIPSDQPGADTGRGRAAFENIAEDLHDRDEIILIPPATSKSPQVTPSQVRATVARATAALSAVARERGIKGLKFLQHDDDADALLRLVLPQAAEDLVLIVRQRIADTDR